MDHRPKATRVLQCCNREQCVVYVCRDDSECGLRLCLNELICEGRSLGAPGTGLRLQGLHQHTDVIQCPPPLPVVEYDRTSAFQVVHMCLMSVL